MNVKTFVVHCEWDREASVWYVSDSNVPGLVAEASTPEGMESLLLERIPELVQLNSHVSTTHACDVPLELILKQHSNLRIAC